SVYRMLLRYEGNICSCVSISSIPPSTMHIILKIVRCIVIDNELQLLDIKATRCHGCCYENWEHSCFEVLDGRITINLVLASVDGHTRIALTHHISKETISCLLSINKD